MRPSVVMLTLALLGPLSSQTVTLGVPRVSVGSIIANVELPAVDGTPGHLLPEHGASVIVFFKPGQEHTRTALQQIARLEQEFTTKAVRWVGIVSGRIPLSNVVAEIASTRLAMPVLIDRGDALYGRLGVIQEPALVFVDADHRLAACQAYARVNFGEILRARLRHLLGEISDQDLAAALAPAIAGGGGVTAHAQARLHLAERLLRSGRTNQALEGVKTSLDEDPSSAAAHLLLGQILFALGRKSEARRAFEQVLQLEPGNETARRGVAESSTPGNLP